MIEKLSNLLYQRKVFNRITLLMGKEVTIKTAVYTNGRLLIYVDTESHRFTFTLTPEDEVQIVAIDDVFSISDLKLQLKIAEIIQSHISLNNHWRDQ